MVTCSLTSAYTKDSERNSGRRPCSSGLQYSDGSAAALCMTLLNFKTPSCRRPVTLAIRGRHLTAQLDKHQSITFIRACSYELVGVFALLCSTHSYCWLCNTVL